ncbi:restriction endonuclease subunit S, partial [Halovibrio sp. HP20-50]|uniref:restriction endonuclease subunit S n=1 Tax=Halovibrio sp. HP20-59 TaxID=3080275 RepID=UPI00294AA2C7
AKLRKHGGLSLWFFMAAHVKRQQALDKCDQEHPKKRLSDICQFRSGGTPSKKKAEYWDGNIPWVSGRDMKTAYMYDSQLHISESAISESVTRLAPAGALLVLVRGMGLAHGAQVTELMVPCAFNQDIKAILPEPNVVSSYLLFSLKHKINASENTLSAAAHGTLKINSEELKNLLIPLPPLGVQKEIVSKFIDISESTKRLVAVSKLKISALLELKQSLLLKAFSGELTANNVVEITAQKQPKGPIDTNSPEFAAYIMAAAYHWHASQSREKTFGRVKAQKTLHLMESLADIDLGRQPIKDAAGPNDFQHMQRAEEWARDRCFFEFVKRPTGQRGYDFRKGGHYGDLVAEAMQALTPYENVLKRVVKLLMPLNTAETEILATAYAAWNNLLLEGIEPSENAIIHEARENWHADKLKYSEEQFRNAISQLRHNGLVPQGRGKRVTGQESLAL